MFALVLLLQAASAFLVQPLSRTHTTATIVPLTTFRQHLTKPSVKDDESETASTTTQHQAATELQNSKTMDQRIAEQFEADENSPETIDAACKGDTSDEQDKPDRIFDPMGLWTPHSHNFLQQTVGNNTHISAFNSI